MEQPPSSVFLKNLIRYLGCCLNHPYGVAALFTLMFSILDIAESVNGFEFCRPMRDNTCNEATTCNHECTVAGGCNGAIGYGYRHQLGMHQCPDVLYQLPAERSIFR